VSTRRRIGDGVGVRRSAGFWLQERAAGRRLVSSASHFHWSGSTMMQWLHLENAMTAPDVLRRTREAANYLIQTHGIPCSNSLRKWRRRAPQDTGEHGPDSLVDPVSGVTWYPQSALDAFAGRLRERLTRDRPAQPSHLASLARGEGASTAGRSTAAERPGATGPSGAGGTG
jgi:transposase-like protein